MTQTFYMVPAAHHSSAAIWLFIALALLSISVLLYTTSAQKRVRYTIANGALKIRGDLYRRTLPIAQIDTAAARTVIIGQQPDLRPTLRKVGTALPGYYAGWFRLAGGSSALVYLNDQSRVVYAPVRDASSLLLSVDRPQEFLSALRLAVVDRTVAETFAMPPSSSRALYITIPASVLVIAVLLFLVRAVYWGGHAEYRVSPNGLQIRGDYDTTVAASALDTSHARRLDFGADAQLRPVRRTNGIGLPGYRAGWFRLQNGDRAFLCLTDPSRVVYIPTTAGYALELSVENPDTFLAALRRTAAKSM